jgi:uncharacterized protein (TIGR03437 family)
MQIHIPFLLVCTMIGSALGQSIPITGQEVPDLTAYDSVVTSLMQKYQVPGVALAVARDGRLVFARGYGYADTDLQLPVQPDSLFRLASVTKPHTAAAIFKLIEQGKLSLSDKAFSILSNLKPLPGTVVDPRIATITIQELLEHESGWYGEADGTHYDPMFDAVHIAQVMGTPAPADCPTMIRYELGRPLDTDPGTYYSYLNFGYCILGEVIHQVTGVPYDVYLKANVTGPIGNSRTALGGSLQTDQLPGEVTYYDFPGAALVASVFPPFGMVSRPYGGFSMLANEADGGLVSSTMELLRFLTSINGDGATQLLQTPPATDPPHGLGVPPFGQGWVWYFNGGIWGTSTGLFLDSSGTQGRTDFAFLANSRPASAAWYTDMNDQLLDTGRQITNWPTNDLFPQFQTSFAVVHAATFGARALAPDEFATIEGVNLAVSTASASSTPFPISLANDTVTIMDSSGATLAAPLVYVSPQQINFLVPSQAQLGPATITVAGSVGGSLSANVWIDPVSPGLFTMNSSGVGVPAALATRYTASGSQVQEAVFQCTSVCTAVGIDMGAAGDRVILQLFGTGLRHASSSSSVSATIGGENATVLYAGAQGTYAGLDQVNVTIPQNLAGAGSAGVVVQVDGRVTNVVTIQIN